MAPPLLKHRVWLCCGLLALCLASLGRGRALAGERARAEYVVKQGDALGVIAARTGVPLDTLLKVNQLKSADKIRSGQVLALPIEYRVAPGDVLGAIAERHGIRQSRLCQDNAIAPTDVLKVGQRLLIVGGYLPQRATEANGKQDVSQPHPSDHVRKSNRDKRAASSKTTSAVEEAVIAKPPKPKPEYVAHRVRKGEVLSRIAQRFRVKRSTLQRLNKLGKQSLIRTGQSLKVPVTEANRHITRPAPPKPWKKYALKKFTHGYVKLQAHERRWGGHVIDKKGNLSASARRAFHSMLGAWLPNKRVALSERLIHLVVQVSDEFGGRPIRVVSGYRRFSHARFSKHKVGRALDFSIPGVPNAAVRDFLLTLPNVGVGYYPNSTHVHLDDRPSRMYWVDVSRPGQAPRYVHKSRTGKKRPSKRNKSRSAKSQRVARLGSQVQR